MKPPAIQPDVTNQSPTSYVALGDSYSSGDGAGNYSDGNCLQSANAYPVLWHKAHGGSFVNETCAGATTSDVISSQLGPLSASTTLVTITIGGNDVGFASVMETCVLGSDSSCVSAIDQAEQQAQSTLPGSLDTVLSDIASRAPNARPRDLRLKQLPDLGRLLQSRRLLPPERQRPGARLPAAIDSVTG